MKNNAKKIISLMLSLLLIIGMIPVGVYVAKAATPTVKIVSFMRGEQTSYRSSELLEARVEGYDGNVRELSYRWTSSLGTYLYVFNDHNMYGINNTDGEIEIYNSAKKINNKAMAGLSNMVGRSYDKTYTGKGFAWAAIYGADLTTSSLTGTVTVEVLDENNNVICKASHSSFSSADLDKDMDNVVIGIFEGETRNVKDLLGESAIVHITCTASTVNSGKIISGSDHISLYQETKKENADYGEYFITGTAAGTSTDSDGDATVQLKISKSNCKFHKNKSGTADTTVFVFKKPYTETTTTTLTLTGNLDDRCDYFIEGREGEKQADGTIIFTGLTPNTSYTVEVRGEYMGKNNETKYAYAYVYDTTKPVYSATVYTYLDGELTDIGVIHGDDVVLYLHEDKEGADYIELNHTETGTYSASVENGIYFPWHIEADDHYHQAREYKLIIENANGTLNLHHYSVSYDTNGGAFAEDEEVAVENYSSAAAVTATENIPVRDGFAFAGWEYEDKLIRPGMEVTSGITAPIVLKAKWEKEVDVTINVTINHKVDGGYDSNDNRDELTVGFLEMTADSPAFVETGDVLYFAKENVTDENGNKKEFEYFADIKGSAVLETKYTALAPTYTGLLESSMFGVAVSKSGYDVASVEKTQDEDGNWTIDITLDYNPDDFDLDFSVKMAEDVPAELYPDAVIVKIACWDEELGEWLIITQQRTTENTVRPGVRVDIDPVTGEGAGSYPVWKTKADGSVYGYRAVVTGFIYDNSTIIVPTEKDHTKGDGAVVVTYTDGNYTATMGNVADGQKFSTSLYGAYYNEEAGAQQGTLDAVITVEKYDVTFDAQGGIVNGKDADVAAQQYYIPSFSAYQPEMDGHKFLGWFLDEACTAPASEGVLLTDDITLYAKWDRVLTGTVIVDGYYDSTHIVNLHDRATHALVELKEITNDGEYNIAGQTVVINWVADKHFSEPVSYRFEGLDPDKTYRADVYLVNYDAAYQNADTVINGNDDIHDDYNETDYKAIYNETYRYETFVNIFMHFEPEVYFQNVEVDATRIGEGFRPQNVLVEYIYKDTGTDNDFNIITQHKSAPFGVEVGMGADGTNDGIYGEDIWKKVFNGNLYDYQANLTKIDGNAVNFEEYPVLIVYGDTVRWSPYNQAPTDSLKVTLIPMWYDINYVWNDGTDYTETVSRGHIWSYSTEISYVPTLEGHTFGGWYLDAECSGTPVTSIAADVAEDTTLYAKWEKTPYNYTVNYLEEGTDNVLASAKIAGALYKDTVTEEAIYIDGYTVSGDNTKSVVITSGDNVINFYYVTDTIGGGVDGDEGDGVPDKFQKKVIFTVVNGSWADGETFDKLVFPVLMTDGEPDVNGTAALIAPDGMLAKEGYTNGKWDIVPPSTVSGTDTESYIFRFEKRTDLALTVNHVDITDASVLETEIRENLTFGESFTAEELKKTFDGFSYAGASADNVVIAVGDNEITLYYTRNTYSYTVNYLEEGTDDALAAAKTADALYKTEITEAAIEIDGYMVSGDSTKSIVIDTEDNVISFYYVADAIGGGDDGDKGDNIPDKYQKKVIFRVVNGTWADGTAAEKVLFLELKTDGSFDENGTAELIAPEGMLANDGFKNGQWDAVPPAIASTTATEIYTYSFSRATTPVVPSDEVYYVVEHYLQNADGTYSDEAFEVEILAGTIGSTVVAVAKNYDGYMFNEMISDATGILTEINTVEDIVVLKLYYDIIPEEETTTEEETTAPDEETTAPDEETTAPDEETTAPDEETTAPDEETTAPDEETTAPDEETTAPDEETTAPDEETTAPDEETTTPVIPDEPATPDAPGGSGNEGSDDFKLHVVFGKTDGIGWYNVSTDGGLTYQMVFGNSTLEVAPGTKLIISVGDIMGDSFVFYVNGSKVQPDDNGKITVTVDNYMLIGALSSGYESPDIEESLNFFEKLINAIKAFFDMIASWFK